MRAESFAKSGSKNADRHILRGQQKSLSLFHEASVKIPAYKDFLKKHGVRHDKVKSYSDFQKIPPTDKQNYLKQYKLTDLMWPDALQKPTVFTSSSGSSGEKNYFLWGENVDAAAVEIHDNFLNNRKSNKPILIIDAFSMGVWIAGLLTYQAFFKAAERSGHKLSIITPGINKDEILKSLKNLSPFYEQTILAGYPPFVKDIVDAASDYGINLKKLNIRFLFAAEPFSEVFREHLAKKAGVKNLILDTMNIYGSADMGSMAFETPLSILIRRFAIRKEKVFKDLFRQSQKTPTLAQFNPDRIFFEAEGQELLLTGDNVMPLIRYSIGDNGGVYDFSAMKETLKKYGFDLRKQAVQAGIVNNFSKDPFVYVYERKDFSTTLYGLQIFPQTIRDAILKSDLRNSLTGKFFLATKFDKRHNQFLEVNLEMYTGEKKTKKLEEHISSTITKALLKHNSEFKELHAYLKDKAVPKIVLWPQGDQRYFKIGIKQIWTQRNLS